ncbi:MAG: hypothetical protein NVSMB46_03590 [Candidatus Saccharimonadales bacterium]
MSEFGHDQLGRKGTPSHHEEGSPIAENIRIHSQRSIHNSVIRSALTRLVDMVYTERNLTVNLLPDVGGGVLSGIPEGMSEAGGENEAVRLFEAKQKILEVRRLSNDSDEQRISVKNKLNRSPDRGPVAFREIGRGLFRVPFGTPLDEAIEQGIRKTHARQTLRALPYRQAFSLKQLRSTRRPLAVPEVGIGFLRVPHGTDPEIAYDLAKRNNNTRQTLRHNAEKHKTLSYKIYCDLGALVSKFSHKT